MSHTPGPWRVSSFEVSAGAVGRTVMGADDFSIGYIGERDREENEANARLIAAAPRMYDILRAWHDAKPGDDGPYCDAWQLLKELEGVSA